MKKIIALLVCVLMVFAIGACTQQPQTDEGGTAPESNAPEAAASDWEYIKDKGEMIVGITLFAPMNYEKDGELTGFETEFAQAVGQKLGVEMSFDVIDWNSKEMELQAKTIDCVWNGMTITDERKENMSISIPYMNNKQVMIVKEENVDKYKESVEGALIVAETGSAGETLAKENDFFAAGSFTAVDSQAKALLDVSAGSSDVAVVDYVLSIGSIGEGTDFASLKVIEEKEFELEEYGIAFRKGSDVTEKVNSVIKELTADGTLAEIAAKYKLDSLLIVE